MESFYTVHVGGGGQTVVQFRTESLMHPPDLERVGHSLFHLVDVENRHRLVLDFTPVKYLSSQAIGVLLSLHKKVTQHKDGRFVLCGVGPQLLQLLKITRLDRMLKVAATQEDAIAAV